MRPIAVQILAEGFLHPAPLLEREVIDGRGLFHVPISDLDSDMQFFRCRVGADPSLGSSEYILADAFELASRERVQRFLGARFPNATTLFLRSQATGRAVVDSLSDAPLTQDAAAAVAVVLYSAAWDDSEFIAVEGGGSKHRFVVHRDDAGHWAQPVHDDVA